MRDAIVALAPIVACVACVACGRPQPTREARRPERADSTAPAERRADATPALRYVLRPRPGTPARLEVELTVSAPASVDLGTLTFARGTSGAGAITARDARGGVEVRANARGEDVGVTLARRPVPPLAITYSVPASGDVRAPTTALVVADDRFRGMGEAFVLLPDALADIPCAITVTIDGALLHAPDAASSFGLGTTQTRRALGRAAARAAFFAGALGRASFDSPPDRDDAAWLGYTAFDPRPAAAEVAQIRTALRELWKGGGDAAFTMLVVSSARPVGAYTLLPRPSSLVLHLGPGEPWSTALRVGVAQTLMRAWIGGELRIGSGEAEATWLYDGLSRLLAAQVLSDLGLLGPDEARRFVDGLLEAHATSPHRGAPLAALASAGASDATMRAHVTATGALHALRIASLLRERKRLSTVVLDLVERTRRAHGPLPPSAWRDVVVAELGEAEGEKLTKLLEGGEVELPPGALGPCFRREKTTYTTFDLGFDVVATSESASRTIVRLDPNGPAASAGLRDTDVLEQATYRDGVPEAPARLVVLRMGERKEIAFTPRGPRRPGTTFVWLAGKREEECRPL